MKYRLGDKFLYEVLDKWDEADEVLRLQKMMDLSRAFEKEFGEEYTELWIKNTPII